MEEKLLVYRYDILQRTFRVSNHVKQELFKESPRCFMCGNEPQNMRFLKVISYVPIMFGGSVVDKSNFKLACPKCSYRKTITDRNILKSLKSMGIMLQYGCAIESVWNLDLLKKFYSDNFDLIRRYKVAEHSDKEIMIQELKWC